MLTVLSPSAVLLSLPHLTKQLIEGRKLKSELAVTHRPLPTFPCFVDSFYLSFPVPLSLTIHSCTLTLMGGKEREINTCAQPPCFIRRPRTFLQMKVKLSNSKKCFKIQFDQHLVIFMTLEWGRIFSNKDSKVQEL